MAAVAAAVTRNRRTKKERKKKNTAAAQHKIDRRTATTTAAAEATAPANINSQWTEWFDSSFKEATANDMRPTHSHTHTARWWSPRNFRFSFVPSFRHHLLSDYRLPYVHRTKESYVIEIISHTRLWRNPNIFVLQSNCWTTDTNCIRNYHYYWRHLQKRERER